MSADKEFIIDKQTGARHELVPEKPIDHFFAIVSIVYLLLMLLFFLWQLFDVWIGNYILAQLVRYPHMEMLGHATFHLAVYAFIGGALGGIVNGIRSLLIWHADRFAFSYRYFWKYLTAPWLGAGLGLFTYALIQGGIAVFGTSSAGGTASPSQVLATLSTGVLAGYGWKTVLVWLDNQVVLVFKVPARRVGVPSLIDLKRDAAQDALQKAGLKLGRVEDEEAAPDKEGKVIKQVPAQDISVDSGSSVDITIGRSPESPAQLPKP